MEVIIKEAGNRLDKSLADLTELSRSQANEAIKAGTVLVNGKSAKAKYVVKEGDVITYVLPEEEVLEYKAEDIPLDIIYEDADVAVVNKPQGIVVHPSAGHTSGTLVNALMYHVKDLSSINGVVRPGIVHRIDKDTSGLLMIAKNDKAHNALAAELKDKKSLRKYVAIVHGNLPNDRGVIEAPIGRSDKDRKKQAVTAKGKPAVTRFTVLERFGNYTLVELQWKQVVPTRFVCTWRILVTRWREILFMGHARPSRAMDNFYMLRPLVSRILRQANWSNLPQKNPLFSRRPWRN